MQKINHIFRLLIFVSTLFSAQLANSQEVTNEIILADSLFNQKKYTESLEVYEELLSVQKQYTPQMLLKMAFIKEGLKDYSKALYYLNLYYAKTTDKRALKKMEKLAKTNELNGYNYTDTEFFTMIYQRYANYLSIFLMAVAFFLLVLLYKNRSDSKPIATGVFLSLVLLLLFYHVNNAGFFEKGIITESNAYMMKSPSSGADLMEIIDKGHRVNVTDKNDVWLEIEWEGEKGFVREGNISIIK